MSPEASARMVEVLEFKKIKSKSKASRKTSGRESKVKALSGSWMNQFELNIFASGFFPEDQMPQKSPP